MKTSRESSVMMSLRFQEEILLKLKGFLSDSRTTGQGDLEKEDLEEEDTAEDTAEDTIEENLMEEDTIIIKGMTERIERTEETEIPEEAMEINEGLSEEIPEIISGEDIKTKKMLYQIIFSVIKNGGF